MTLEELGPFDEVLDVGGNIGLFAERCRDAWPDARITSFEPLPGAVHVHRDRARNRWWVEQVAVSSQRGEATLHFCTNQHTASSLHTAGVVRRERFGLRDTFQDITVRTETLDRLIATTLRPRTLLKVDVEGHELEVLRGAERTLDQVTVCVVEVNQGDVFQGAPAPVQVDGELRRHGLSFTGVIGVVVDGAGDVVQFDGVWSR